MPSSTTPPGSPTQIPAEMKLDTPEVVRPGPGTPGASAVSLSTNPLVTPPPTADLLEAIPGPDVPELIITPASQPDNPPVLELASTGSLAITDPLTEDAIGDDESDPGAPSPSGSGPATTGVTGLQKSPGTSP